MSSIILKNFKNLFIIFIKQNENTIVFLENI